MTMRLPIQQSAAVMFGLEVLITPRDTTLSSSATALLLMFISADVFVTAVFVEEIVQLELGYNCCCCCDDESVSEQERAVVDDRDSVSGVIKEDTSLPSCSPVIIGFIVVGLGKIIISCSSVDGIVVVMVCDFSDDMFFVFREGSRGDGDDSISVFGAVSLGFAVTVTKLVIFSWLTMRTLTCTVEERQFLCAVGE